MKGERKLRLVTGGKASGPDGGPGAPPPDASEEPPFTDEELAAAAALREAIERRAEPLVIELKAAHAPGPLADSDLDAIVTRALAHDGGSRPQTPADESAATGAERAAAEQLRAELEGEALAGQGAEVFRALKLAARPTELRADRNEALIEAALRAPLRRKGASVRRIAPATMAALAGVAALAAGAALFLGRAGVAPPPGAATAALVRARSADELFDVTMPFPRRGEESARVDRIASARSVDLRRNRFAAWGIR